jgi:hypothetical protein
MKSKSFCLRPAVAMWAFAAAAVLFTSVGCSKPTGTVIGKVYYNDKVVKGGVVTFVSSDGKNFGKSDIAEDGSFSIADLPLGEGRFTVDTRPLKPNQMADRSHSHIPKDAPPEAAGMKGGGGNADRYVAIPDKYATPETSQLLYTVVAGSQEHKIELTR